MANFLELPFQLNFTINSILLFIAAIIMIASCIRLMITRNLVESIIIMSIFSLLISICYLFMDAPDVAMTETALGACLSTCVLLNIVYIVGEDSKKTSKTKNASALILCFTLIICLSWASQDLPNFGSSESPLQTHLTNYYLENTQTDIGIPSIVAAILASYRGFDTLGETTVILIAGLAVVMITSRRRKPNA